MTELMILANSSSSKIKTSAVLRISSLRALKCMDNAVLLICHFHTRACCNAEERTYQRGLHPHIHRLADRVHEL